MAATYADQPPTRPPPSPEVYGRIKLGPLDSTATPAGGQYGSRWRPTSFAETQTAGAGLREEQIGLCEPAGDSFTRRRLPVYHLRKDREPEITESAAGKLGSSQLISVNCRVEFVTAHAI